MQRNTLILVLLALGLGTFVYFFEIRGREQREQVQQNKQQIFSFAENDLQDLSIKTQNQTIALSRNTNAERPKWLLKSPTQEPANDPIVSYLTDLLVKGKSDRSIQADRFKLAEYGLDRPQATIDIKLKNQKTHQLILGQPDFNRRFLYAQTDPNAQPDGKVNVLLVSTDFENAVNRDISEWKQPATDPPQSPQPTPVSP